VDDRALGDDGVIGVVGDGDGGDGDGGVRKISGAPKISTPIASSVFSSIRAGRWQGRDQTVARPSRE
jgi:hypothetical protein